MISDSDLYRLAIFLGSCAMMMIVLYHFLEVNASDDEPEDQTAAKNTGSGSKGAKLGNTVVPGDGVPLPAAAAAAGGSMAIGGGKGR